ncbi:MAG TPA: EcsC family protein [Thermoanaerobaculia bacterium]|nr:EcsC family protein [Thermoanaerobaculia bacterium]
MPLSKTDRIQLRDARERLENPGLAARLVAVAGRPIEIALHRLPAGIQRRVQATAQSSIEKALSVAIGTLGRGRPPGTPASNRAHKLFTAATGAVGGAFGFAGLAIELPVSTTAMLRSVADVARSQGEDLRSPEARLSCMQVFALGGTSPDDDAAEAGYYALRIALSRGIPELVEILTERGALHETAPLAVRFAARIASRYGVRISEKLAAQAVPVLGALGGAAINLVFTQHFQSMAHGHFTVRRLERAYGTEVVRRAYLGLREPGT